jgi:hypothetical protein
MILARTGAPLWEVAMEHGWLLWQRNVVASVLCFPVRNWEIVLPSRWPSDAGAQRVRRALVVGRATVLVLGADDRLQDRRAVRGMGLAWRGDAVIVRPELVEGVQPGDHVAVRMAA